MSELPESINAWAVGVQPLGNDEQAGLWRSVMKPTNSTEYRRADLPPTPAQIAADERVMGLREAHRQTRDEICELAEYVLNREGPGLSEYEAKGIFADLQRARLRMDAALAQFGEGSR